MGTSFAILRFGPLLLGVLVPISLDHVPGDSAPGKRASAKEYAGRTLDQLSHYLATSSPRSAQMDQAVDGMIQIVKDSSLDSKVRERFAIRLGRIGGPASRAVPVFESIIESRHSDPDSNYVWATRALALMGENARSATPALVDLVLDERIPFKLRQAPMEALAMIGASHPDAIPALIRLLRYRPSPRVSAGQAAVFRQLAAESLAIIGPDADVAAPLLIRAVRNPRESESVKRCAILALGALKERGSIGIRVLCEELEANGPPATRDAAADALAQVGDAAVHTLNRYLAHEDMEVRWRVVHAFRLAEARDLPPETLRGLAATLSDPEEMVRLSAAETLANLEVHRSSVARTTIELLTSSDRVIRRRASELIIRLSPLDDSQLDRLSRLREHSNPRVRQTARLVIKRLADQPT